MGRLFISYKREERAYAFAVRQWLMDVQGWSSEDIFVDVGHLAAGVEWEKELLAEAEAAEVMLFLASDLSLDIRSFCYRELQHATGQILAVTIRGVAPDDERLLRAIPDRAKSRQITALDRQPTRPFPFVSPIDNTNGSAQLNADQVASIGATLRDLGLAPDSFAWIPTSAGPYPGLRPLMEGDEALFCGRDLEIRDGLKALEDLRETVTKRALLIQAPSGAGKSSFLRAGLWQRLRRHAGFTPVAIIRAAKGAVQNEAWGLITGLFDTLARSRRLGGRLNLSRGEIEERWSADPLRLLADIADADASEGGHRTLLLGIDQAEEMTLSPEEDAELDGLLRTLLGAPRDLDFRLVLTARDDSVDATLARLSRAGLPQDQVETWRLNRLPATRFDDIIVGPAKAAERAGWPLQIEPTLVDALVAAAGGGDGGDALPILALALQRMVAKRRAPDGRVALRPGDAQGFVESAVAEAAREALTKAGASPDDLRRLVIPRLATWDPGAGAEGAAKRQVTSEASLFAGDRAELRPLAEALVEQRLLTRSKTQAGAAYEVAHEALLRVPPLGELIFEWREKFEQVRVLEIEARDWLAGGRDKDRLGRSGERLHEARNLLADASFGPDLLRSEFEVESYLAACLAYETAQIDKQRRIIGRAFVKPAQEAVTDGLAENALRLAAAGVLLAKDLGFDPKVGTQLWGCTAQAIFANRTCAVLKGHAAAVSVASFSPDGQQIVTASDDIGARLWDAATGNEIAAFLGHTDLVRSASFSPDGCRIVTASDDKSARVWDAATGNEIAALQGHVDRVRNAAFSPDGRRIVTASDDKSARVWDAATGNEIAALEAHTGRLGGASFSPDGKRVVTASSDHSARVWDATTGDQIAVLKGHTDWVRSASFSPDGQWIVTASSSARVWDAATGNEILVLQGHTNSVLNASFSPDSRRIVTASSDNSARVWDAATGNQIAVLQGHTNSVVSASFSPDGRRVVTASDDHTARLWDAATGSQIAALQGHTGGVSSASFNPNGQRIVTASSDHRARVWDAATANEIAIFQGHTSWVRSASFSPDGRRIVTASSDHSARLWDVETGKRIATLQGHADGVLSASFSPDGRRIVTASSDHSARLWDVATGKQIATLQGHTSNVLSASFSPDGRRIVTASSDHSARLWDVATGKQIATLQGHTDGVLSAAFSPDGRRIVTASNDRKARLWDAATGNEVAVLNGHAGIVWGVSFSPDGRRIVTASFDHSARLWDAATGDETAILQGHSGTVWSALFSPDGVRIVTASDDRSARLWDAATGNEIAALEGHSPT